uniref:THAP domain-containing protein 1 n=1 Tax=Oncorhynchus mykiss TaxID=8022 RepID=A0A8C7LTL8_ONCMY
MEYCSVPLCTSSEKYSLLSFHSFPSDTELRAKWVINIHRENFPITSHSKVCGRHFLPHDFIEPCGLRRLKKGAVPFQPVSLYTVRCTFITSPTVP